MHPHRITDERAFADTQEVPALQELPIVADPDLCSDDEMPETIPDGSYYRSVGLGRRRGNLVIE